MGYRSAALFHVSTSPWPSPGHHAGAWECDQAPLTASPNFAGEFLAKGGFACVASLRLEGARKQISMRPSARAQDLLVERITIRQATHLDMPQAANFFFLFKGQKRAAQTAHSNWILRIVIENNQRSEFPRDFAFSLCLAFRPDHTICTPTSLKLSLTQQLGTALVGLNLNGPALESIVMQ